MKLWIDTEFNGFQGKFISLALIDENNQSFYECVPCEKPVLWVKENVIPVLNKEPISLKNLQIKLEAFLKPYATIHIYADWPEDISHFCQVLITSPGTRIDTPPTSMSICRYLDSEG